MPDPNQQVAGVIYRSSGEILAHARFAAARAAFVDAVLGLYEGDRFLNRLLEASRQIIFNLIISLHFRHDETDRATWPTMRLLKESSERACDTSMPT